MGRGAIEIAERHGLLVVSGEFPAAAADGAEAIAAGFEDAARLGRAVFCDEEVEVELRAQFEARHGERSERKAFQCGVGKPRALKAVMDCGGFFEERSGALGVVGEILLQAGENGFRQEAGEIFVFEAVEEVEGEAAEVEPVQRLLPFAAGEEPEAETLLWDRITEDKEKGFPEFLLAGQGGSFRFAVERARKMRIGFQQGAGGVDEVWARW